MSDNLIQRWRHDHDERAAEALYQAHHERVYRLAYALLGEASEAEDVMQNTMVYALARIDLFDPQRASFTIWLHTIVTSRCRDHKQRKRLPTAPLDGRMIDGGDVAAIISRSEERAAGKENQQELWQALGQLSPKPREAIVLRYWAGHTYQEMAQILRCPLPTAQSRVRLAYEQIRELLAPASVFVLGGEKLR
jgi:RNA polymerase sigma-70 factor (ECF subfamily)